jgi:uncharacterized protein YbjT (DUF2867 family)
MITRQVLSQLRATGAADVRALVRPGKTAHRPDGVDVATGSLDDPDGLATALTGVTTHQRGGYPYVGCGPADQREA